jgi:hypothetical protein
MKFLKLTCLRHYAKYPDVSDIETKIRIDPTIIHFYEDFSHIGEREKTEIKYSINGKESYVLVLETIEEIDKMLAEPTWRIAP